MGLTSEFEKNIGIMIQRPSFWAGVLGVKGTYANLIHSSPSYKKAKTIFFDLVRRLQNGSLNEGCINKLRYSEVELNALCESGIFLKDDLWKLVQNVLHDAELVVNNAQSCCKLFPKIQERYMQEGYLKPCDLLEYGIGRLHSWENAFKFKGRNLDEYKSFIADVLGTSNASLPDNWKKLFTVVDSQVFWNLVFMEKPPHAFETASEIVSSLANDGIIKFEQLWGTSRVTLREANLTFPKGIDIAQELVLAKAILPQKSLVQYPIQHLELIRSIRTDEEFFRCLQEVLDVFSLTNLDSNFNLGFAVMEGLSEETDELLEKDIGLLGTILCYLDKLTQDFNTDYTSILDALSKSEKLIEFLQPIIKEDITYLVDAVEEFGEQVLSEGVVSSLITVKEFVQSLFDTNIKSVPDFLCQLSKECGSVTAADIAICNKNLSGLKALYRGLSDKEARAKQIIQHILRCGIVHYKQIRTHSVICAVHVTYVEKQHRIDTEPFMEKENYNEEEYKSSTISEQKLQDLRSQALFISSYNKPSKSESLHTVKRTKVSMEDFVNYVDQTMRISQLIDHLQEVGHYEYGTYEKKIPLSDLSVEENRIDTERQEWIKSLEIFRQKYVWLNYIYGEQLQKIEKFLRTRRYRDDVDALLRYIHADVDLLKLRISPCIDEPRSATSVLDAIGRYLCSVFDHLEPVRRSFKISKTSKKLQDTIMKGRLAIVRIGLEHDVLSKTILALYLNTTKTLPEPHQLIICDHTTQWGEVSLLLKRCMIAGQENKDSVYCVAGTETLPSALKFKLANEIKELQESTTGNFRLGLIFKGSIHETFLHFFRDYVVDVDEIATLTFNEMSECLRLHCKGVRVVKSDKAGLGKTEYIKKYAMENRLRVMVFHASGSFTKMDLIQDLQRLHLSSDSLLHIDIGEMDRRHAHLLDNFVFEMVILRVVTSGTMSCLLNTKDIWIEIPNSFHDQLKYNLPTLVHFETTTLDNRSFLKYFIASPDHKSAMQIVCKYLEHYDSGNLDSSDPSLVHKSKHLLSSEKCKMLLEKYFICKRTVSYTNINTFVKILGTQLRMFSESNFVRHSGIMVPAYNRKSVNIRTSLTKTLIDRAKEICTLSEENSKKMQIAAMAKTEDDVATADYMTKRDQSIIRWENGISYLIVLNFDKHSITPLYRNLKDVPIEVQHFFRNQMQHELPQSIYSLTPNNNDLFGCQNELHRKLQRIVGTKRKLGVQHFDRKYILTPDNMLKMVLIFQRLTANLPVVIIGETGCGKTSLIKYLAEVSETKRIVYNIHAGLSRDDICAKISLENRKAREKINEPIWLFLDEINTSEHIGILSDAVCHGRILNEILAPNIRFIAACNPYRLRSRNNILTAGIDSKIREHCDEMSRLVYRVHPLPETMMSHVWDFGVVNENDEHVYIKRMLEYALHDIPGAIKEKLTSDNINILFANLLSTSQSNIRQFEKEEFSVSLRDIDRCTRVFRFFLDFLEKKRSRDTDVALDAMILSLAHCYYYRLKHAEHRSRYRENLARAITEAEIGKTVTPKYISAVINKEQTNLLDRMTMLPEFTAKNAALKENVFVLLVSILTRIPIFLIGHPGCSKSLSIQLIRRHLRGKNSENELFKKLPHVIFFSYQGSESSTSRGIEKVFKRATLYQQKNNEDDIRAVVLLDEVGLAEISPNNPLKVLHNLLEPNGKRIPDVGVVGISNWALDAAKMNRAVHLSRPQMTLEELKDTAAQIGRAPNVEKPIPLKMINVIATAYYYYVSDQPIKNFHGLRDIYALIKYITSHSGDSLNEALLHGLLRNFGGDQSSLDTVSNVFSCHLAKEEQYTGHSIQLSVLKVIEENLSDQQSRHLMLVSDSDIGVIELKQILRSENRTFEIMYGSHFPLDASEVFDNHSLSRVILCMEKGKVLILHDFPSIYGSLYDMLNRNYMVIKESDKQEKQYCRIAYGPYSNPMCIVHEHFKCVVVVGDTDVTKIDPPFLNRFEKQFISINDLVTENHYRIANEIKATLQQLVPKSHANNDMNSIVPHLSHDSILSLVLRASKECETSSNDNIRDFCLRSLLCVAKPEAVLCFDDSTLQDKNSQLVEMLVTFYDSQPLHKGIKGFLEGVEQNSSRKLEHTSAKACLQSESSNLYVVLTHSNIHSSNDLQIEERSRAIVVADIESLNELNCRLDEFFNTEESEYLLLHLAIVEEKCHLDIIKNAVETYLYKGRRSQQGTTKRCFLVLHLDRNKETKYHMNFSSEWTFIYLDSVREWHDTITDLCQTPLLDILKERKEELKVFLQNELPWAFTRIQYEPGCERSLTEIQHCIDQLSSDEVLEYMFDIVLRTVKSTGKSSVWIKEIAQNESKLCEASTFRGAIQNRLKETVKFPMAKIIYRLDELRALEILCNPKEDRKRNYLLRVLSKEGILSLDELKTLDGPGCYVLKDTRQRTLPVSDVISEIACKTIDSNLVYFEGIENTDIVERLSTLLQKPLSVFLESSYYGIENDYLIDFCDSCTLHSQNSLSKNERLFIWLWTAKYSIYLTNAFNRKYIENKMCAFENQDEKSAYKTPETSAGEIYLLIAFLHVHQDQCKEIMDAFFRMISVLKNNISINIVDVIKEENETTQLRSSAEALGQILKSVCKGLSTNPLWLHNVSPRIWHKTCMSLFSIAKVIFDEAENLDFQEFHILRFLCDFVALVLIPLEVPISSVCELGSVLDDITLQKTFDAFKDFLVNIERNHKDKISLETCIYIQTLYVYRCLAYCPQATSILEMHLNDIQRDRLTPRFLKHVLYAGIATKMYYTTLPSTSESDETDIRLLQYIESPNTDFEEDEFVTFMDAIVDKLHGSLDITCIVDVLENELRENIRISLEMVEKAVKLSLSSDVTFLKLLSIAYLRVSAELVVIGKVITEHQQDIQIIVHRLFSNSSIETYFWRIARYHGISVKTLQEILPRATSKANTSNNYLLENNPISLYCRENYNGVMENWNDLVEGGKLVKSIEVSLELCGIFHSRIYLRQNTHNIEKEKEIAIKIIEADETMNVDQMKFLKCLASIFDFSGSCLRESETVSSRCLSEFLIQLGAVILFSNSFKSKRLFYKLITKSDIALFQHFTPGQSRVSIDGKVCVNCVCGYRTVIATDTDKCPMCERELICKCKDSSESSSNRFRCKDCSRYKLQSQDPAIRLKVGTPFEIETSDKIRFFGCKTRNLNALSFRLTELLVFGCLTIRDSLGHEIKSLSSENLAAKMTMHWDILRRQLSMCDYDLLLCLQAFLLKYKGYLGKVRDFRDEDTLDKWEIEFTELCCTFMGRRTKEISSMITEYNAYFKNDRKGTNSILSEKAHANDNDCDLYRIVTFPTVENLLCELELSGNHYPFLQLAVIYQPMLRLPKFLPHFLRWYQLTLKYNRYQMTRSERKTLSVWDLIQRLPENKIIQEEFRIIQQHWNDLPSHLKRLKYLGFNVPDFELKTIDEDTKVDYCMVANEDSTLKTIIFYLARAQNEFIDEVLKLDSEYVSPAAGFLKDEHGRSFIRRVPLSRLHSGEVFNFELSEFLNLSQALPFTGQGDVILYDFWKIETEAVVRLLEGKAYIDLPPHLYQIQFKDDLFSNSAYLLTNIRSMINQRPLEEKVEKELREKLSENPTLAGNLLSAIGILLTVAYNSAEKDIVTMVEFMDKWKELHNMRAYRGIPALTDGSLRLYNIVPLYLVIESVIGERIVRTLTYTALDSRMTTELKKMLEKDRSVNKTLKDSVCVFVLRSLNVENPDLEMHSSLVDHLDNESYWPVEKGLNPKAILNGIPRDIKLVHLKALHKLLQVMWSFIFNK